EWRLSLDDAIRIALENAQGVRILAGLTAVSSGQTIYDAAITNTTIDQAQAAFDPVYHWDNNWSRLNTPFAILDPGHNGRYLITGTPTDTYLSDMALTKKNVLGGMWSVDWTERYTRIPEPGPFPLNPQTAHGVTLRYDQPFLQGAGFRVNMAPIVIARLNT